MKTRTLVARTVGLRCLLAGMLTLGVMSLLRHPLFADSAGTRNISITAAAQKFTNYSVEQQAAIARAKQTQKHPVWKTLSWSERLERAAMFATQLLAPAQATSTSLANYQGNLTLISAPSPQGMILQRETDCSLTMSVGTYTYALPPTIQLLSSTRNYGRVLHDAAGLKTQAGVFANGCAEPTLGVGSRRGFYLGKTSQNLLFFASSGYDHASDSNALYYGTVDATTTVHSFKTDISVPELDGIAVGDMNGDGLADIVGLDRMNGAIAVWIAHADGTVSTSVPYAVPGEHARAAVMTDVNGDGKVDVVVASDSSAGAQTVSVLTGKGDGTLNAVASMSVTLGTNPGNGNIVNMVATDLRGTGHPDIVASNGVVLLNNGSGTFIQGTAAFSATFATSSFGPNLAAADFNKDGKPDIATDDGTIIRTFVGKGDGTFSAGRNYASIDNVGYLTASDLDGDGNVDLYVGLANGGMYAGDQFEVRKSYALMGNGDGTFQGAPIAPFTFAGYNLGDLNGDGSVDGIGVNKDATFTVYLGNGKGDFAAGSNIAVAPIVPASTSYPLSNIDSYALGDIHGDGKADLVYIGAANSGSLRQVFYAQGDGHGAFGATTAIALPSFVEASDFDIDQRVSNLRLADVNHDGKADLVYSYSDTSYRHNTYITGTGVQLSNGDGTFQLPKLMVFHSATTNYFPTSNVVLVSDFNQDSNPDLLFVTQSSTIDRNVSGYVANLQVALGHGDGTFGAPADVAGPNIMVRSALSQSTSATVADMNGDGIPDIVALGSSTSYDVQVAVMLGNGDGTFKAPALKTYSVQFLGNENVAIADFDGDGKLDAAITDAVLTNGSGISFGNGDGTLQAVSTDGGVYPNLGIKLTMDFSSTALDINGDSKPDLFSGSTLLLSQAAPTTTVPAPATPDFSLSASVAAGTVTAGQSATTTLTLTPSGGFNQSVSLSCSGLPAGATCSFSPAAVTVNGSAATSVLTITTIRRTAMKSIDPLLPGGTAVEGIVAPFVLAWRQLSKQRPRRVRRRLGFAALALIGFAALNGCGGGGGDHDSGSSASTSTTVATGTTTGTYQVTITATSGALTHSAPYALTVN